jgi:protein-histidine pros-kinase
MRLPGPLTADQDKQLRTIQSSARHLLSLINDILDLARIESGRVEPAIEAVAIQGVIHEVATALRPLAAGKGLSFEVSTPARDVIVQTDRRALSQILINLTNNAIKFTESGFVRLEMPTPADGRVRVTVADTGVGIKLEDREKLFQAFSQADATSHRRYEGTGLGLHLSQKLAGLLDGSIAFTSEPGRGSRFTLTLPVG